MKIWHHLHTSRGCGHVYKWCEGRGLAGRPEARRYVRLAMNGKQLVYLEKEIRRLKHYRYGKKGNTGKTYRPL